MSQDLPSETTAPESERVLDLTAKAVDRYRQILQLIDTNKSKDFILSKLPWCSGRMIEDAKAYRAQPAATAVADPAPASAVTPTDPPAPDPAPSADPEPVFVSDAGKSMIDLVMHNAKNAFRGADKDLSRTDRDAREGRYQLAILLVLNDLGVKPEAAAPALDLRPEIARKLFDLAISQIQDHRSSVSRCTKALCQHMGLPFKPLCSKL